jgi:hypothetical protein
MKTTITEEVVTQYLETLLWSEIYHGDEDGKGQLVNDGRFPVAGFIEAGTALNEIIDVSDVETLNAEIVEESRRDLEDFRADCLQSIGIDPFKFFDPSQVAHDFALSRNGHGAGFFARGHFVTCAVGCKSDTKSNIADELQDAARR